MSMNWFLVRMPPPILKSLEPLFGLDAEEPEWWSSEEFLGVEGRCPQLFLGQTWHTLHFLLTGQVGGGAGPLGHVILGKTPLGEIDAARLSEGEATYQDPEANEAEILPCGLVWIEEVRAIAAALAALSESDLRARYDPATFQAVRLYPWTDGDGWYERAEDKWFDFAGEALREHILTRFGALTAFYRDAAQAGEAVLQYPMGAM